MLILAKKEKHQGARSVEFDAYVPGADVLIADQCCWFFEC